MVIFTNEGAENWRGFCHCDSSRRATASPVAHQSEALPDEIHLCVALLDDPVAFEPRKHFHWDEHLPRIRIEDDLEKRSVTMD